VLDTTPTPIVVAKPFAAGRPIGSLNHRFVDGHFRLVQPKPRPFAVGLDSPNLFPVHRPGNLLRGNGVNITTVIANAVDVPLQGTTVPLEGGSQQRLGAFVGYPIAKADKVIKNTNVLVKAHFFLLALMAKISVSRKTRKSSYNSACGAGWLHSSLK